MITDGLSPLTVLLFHRRRPGRCRAAVTYVVARITNEKRFARITLRVLLGGRRLYVVLLLIGSVTSRSRVLAPGEEKHICEIDCHLAYSVAASESRASAGGLVQADRDGEGAVRRGDDLGAPFTETAAAPTAATSRSSMRGKRISGLDRRIASGG
jgi:hypothetical protein